MFYLGTHEAHWLERLDVPLFVSHRRLMKRKRLPRAIAGWALDSGGFSELSLYGEWRTTQDAYVAAVERYRQEVGQLEWAAPMDWMCEPHMIEKTGLSVREHQERTVANYLELRDRGPFVPVLQGWEPEDYAVCVDLYAAAGVDLEREPIVGVGSVCRRQNTVALGRVLDQLAGLRLHGFGIKRVGLGRFSSRFVSVDSMAWSYRARRADPMPGHTHAHCSNCAEFALAWRAKTLRQLREAPPQLFQ